MEIDIASTKTGVSRPLAKMGTAAPVEVGTRGTVGSLIKIEMEYFRGLEVGQSGKSHVKSRRNLVDMAPSGGNPWLGFGFLTWRRKKQRSSRFLPSVWSAVEVADHHQLNSFSSFRYRNLNDDELGFEV